MHEQYDLVVLAGGGARRLGGIDKIVLPLNGVSSLERLLASCADATRVVVAGPARETSRSVTWCREEPAGSGPLAAVAAALPQTAADVVVVAAGDMPLLGDAKDRLLAALDAQNDADAAVLRDDEGIRQPLAAAYRRTALLRRIEELGDVAGLPAKLLLANLHLVDVPAGVAAADVDTWDDVHRIEEELNRAR